MTLGSLLLPQCSFFRAAGECDQSAALPMLVHVIIEAMKALTEPLTRSDVLLAVQVGFA